MMSIMSVMSRARPRSALAALSLLSLHNLACGSSYARPGGTLHRALTGDARPRFFESSKRFARGAGAARAKR